MEKNTFTRITCEQPDKKIVWEVPYFDVSTLDLMNAMQTIMTGLTFYPNAIENMCRTFLENTDKYDVIEKSAPTENKC